MIMKLGPDTKLLMTLSNILKKNEKEIKHSIKLHRDLNLLPLFCGIWVVMTHVELTSIALYCHLCMNIHRVYFL